MNQSSVSIGNGNGGHQAWPDSWAEHVYRFLDDRVVHAREGDWRIRVYSVLEDGERLWVQTAAIGSSVCSVLLRVESLADPMDTVAAIESWLSVPQFDENHVIDVSATKH